MHSLFFRSIAVAAILVCHAVSADAVGIDEGHAALLGNRFGDAVAAYEEVARTTEDPSTRAAAYRGIVQARLARMDWSEAVLAAAHAVLSEPENPANVGLAKIMEANIQLAGVPEGWEELIRRIDAAAVGHPVLEEYLLDAKISALRSQGEFDAARSLLDGYANVREFFVVGPFSNTGGSGILRDYPPEHGIDTQAVYTDRFGRSFGWQRVEAARQGRIDFDLLFGDEADAVGYALTHVRAEEEMEAVASIFGSDAFMLWINDEPVLSERRTRISGMSLYEVPITLQRGWNRVLVKAASETKALSFFLSFHGPDGSPLVLEEERDPSVYPDTESQVRQVSGSAPGYTFDVLPEKHWLRAWRKRVESEGLAEWATYLDFLMRHGFEVEFRRALDECDRRFPGSAVIAWNRASLLAAMNREGETSALVRSIMSSAPEHVPAVFAAVSELLGRGEQEEAWNLLQEALDVNPDCIALRVVKATTNLSRGEVAGGLKELEELFEEAPQDMSVRLAYLKVLEFLGDEATRLAALAEAFEHRADDTTTIAALAGIADERGEYDVALDYLDLMSEAGVRCDLVSLLRGTVLEGADRLAEATRVLEDGLACCPLSTSLLESHARVLLMSGDEERAADVYNRCAEREVFGFAKAQLARRLMGQRDLGQRFPKDNISALGSADLSWVKGNADAVRLLDTQHMTVLENGSYEIRMHLVTKILNRAGAERYGEDSVPLFLDAEDGQIEIAKTIKSDGREVAAERGLITVTFVDVEPGDILELRYVSRHAPVVELPGHFWRRHLFQCEMPVLKSRLALLFPSDKTFQVDKHQTEVARNTTTEGGWRLDVWELGEVQALQTESRMPPVTERGMWIDVSTIESWQDVSEWYRDVTRRRLQPCTDVPTEDLTRGAEDDSSKIHIITNYVRENIQYKDIGFDESGFVPRAADEVVRTRAGDCKDQSALIVGMLRTLGIKASLALCNARDYTAVPFLPSPNFTHCIVRAVASGGTEYWIDPTDRALSFPNVPVELEGAQALLIDTPDPSFRQIRLDPPDANGSQSVLTVVMDDDGGYSVEGTCVYKGEDAASLRYLATYSADWLEEAKRDIIASEHPAAAVGSVELSGASSLDEPVVLSFSFDRAGAVSRAGDLSILNIPWTIGRVPYDLVSLEERSTPLVLDSWRGHYTEDVKLVPPDGCTLESELPEADITCDIATFSMTSERLEDGSIILSKDLSVDALRVETDEYSEFRAFLEEAWQAEGRQIVFSSK